MRISFTGDDGFTESMAVVTNDSESSTVTIEVILADSSGRSFLLKLPGSHVSYFWCSEKSTLHGMELLKKMKDLLEKKPTLSHLSGICETRLDSFANHLRAYVLGSSNTPEAISSAAAAVMVASTLRPSDSDPHTLSKSSRARLTAGHTAKGYPFYQGSLSPRSNTFKEGMLRSSSSNRSGAIEKRRRRGDSYSSLLTNNQPIMSVRASPTPALSACQLGDSDKSRDISSSCCKPCCSLPEFPCLPSSLSLSSPTVINLPLSQEITSPLYSPYYCWCPPFLSPLKYTVNPSVLPVISSEPLPLPPLSSLFSSIGPPVSLVPSKLPPIDAANVSLPHIFPETLVHLRLPVSSLVTLPGSQQIPTFTPFMSDPIVHVPMIGVCSSGQGYLVSAGPSISSAIPPLLPSLANPLVPQTESLVEKSARETLRMLMASAPTSSCPLVMPPTSFNSMNESFPFAHVREPGARTGCLYYTGALDVDAVGRGVSSMTLSCSSKGNGAAYGVCNGTDKWEIDDKHSGVVKVDSAVESPLVSEGSSCTEESDDDSSL